MTFEQLIQDFPSRSLSAADVRSYIESGGDLNQQNHPQGWSLLHFAAKDRNPEVIRLLEANGAAVNVIDKLGRTPLFLALETELEAAHAENRPATELPTVEALLELGADETLATASGATLKDVVTAHGQDVLFELTLRRARTVWQQKVRREQQAKTETEHQGEPPRVSSPQPAAARRTTSKKSGAILLVAGLLGLLLVIGLALPPVREQLRWALAGWQNTVKGYDAYLRGWPQGRHAATAAARQDELAWAAAKASQNLNGYWRYVQSRTNGQHLAEAQQQIEQFLWQQAFTGNTLAGYESFLKNYRNSRFAPEARARMEELKWQQAKNSNTIRLLRAYVANYPQGKHVAEARKQTAALLADEKPLQQALAAQTEKALQNFLNDFPGHAQEATARQALKDLTEGRDIFELMADKKIDAYAIGTGTENVLVRLQKLTPGALTVRIPAGLYFAAGYSTVQSMVAMSTSRVRLQTDFWTETIVPAVSANYSKDVPEHENTFEFRRLPPESPLAGLVPRLERAGATYPTWQAAIWIATDNATYEHLGTLTVHPPNSLLENIRLIQETEAARAMKLCAEAGIDITQKKIWKKSLAEILRGLPDAELKSWLEEKQRTATPQ